MALGTKVFNAIVQLNNGLRIPTSAGVGKVLSSDASGNAAWESAPTGLVESSIAMAYASAAQKLKAAGFRKIKLNTAIKDPGSNFSEANHYTVPADGYYQVSGQVEATIPAKTNFLAVILVNEGAGAEILGTQEVLSESSNTISVVSGIVFCKKGEQIALYGYQSGGTEPETVPGAGNCRLNVARVGAGPAGPPGSVGPEGGTGVESSIATAYRKAEQGIGSGAFVKVSFDTAINDPGSNMSLASGYYVVPADGYYHVDSQIEMQLTGAALEAAVVCAVYVNTTGVLYGSRTEEQGKNYVASTVSGIIRCNKGDHIEVYLYQVTGAERKLLVNEPGACRISVARVGAGPAGPAGPPGSGGIAVAEDIGGTTAAPKVVNLHLSADTAVNHKLTTVTDPTEAQDAATKKYVDALTGAWASMVLETSVTQQEGAQTCGARSEGGGTVVRLRGEIKLKEALAAGTIIATLPEGLRPIPSENTFISVNTYLALTKTSKAAYLDVRSNGTIRLRSAGSTNEILSFESLTFNKT
jgi:hypothetical protein